MDEVDALEKQFLWAIGEDPRDRATRCAYADWLEELGRDDEALLQRTWLPERQDAKEWLERWAEGVGREYGEVLKAGETGAYGVGLNFDPGNHFARHPGDVEVFWRSWELVTGVEKDEGDKSEDPFMCCSWVNNDDDEGDDGDYR